MSSLFNEKYNAVDIKSAIRFVVQDLQGLAAYVRAKMETQALSHQDVAARAGGAISHTTVWNVANSAVKEVKQSTLSALARGLGVSEDEIFAVARGVRPTTPNTADQHAKFIVEEFSQLSDDAKAALRPIWEMVQREVRHQLEKEHGK